MPVLRISEAAALTKRSPDTIRKAIREGFLDATEGRFQGGRKGEPGVTRYKLLPLPGWAVLVSKTAALLLVVGLLTIHLAILPCLAGMLVVAAVSQMAAIIERSDQVRWRFSSGPTLRMGFVQLPALGLGLGGTYYWPTAGIVLSVLIFGVTTWWNGHLLE